MKYAITWLIVAVIIALGLGNLNWLFYYRMSQRGVPSQATVIELHPKRHALISYDYTVEKRLFHGEMQSNYPNPPLAQLSVGQRLVMYYDPAHPDKSVLGDPRPILWSETVSIVLAAVVMPTFFVLVWARKSSSRHTSQQITR